jgi:hypothetical protein
LVLPLHPSIVLPLSTIRGPWLTALWIRITLAITYPQITADCEPQ